MAHVRSEEAEPREVVQVIKPHTSRIFGERTKQNDECSFEAGGALPDTKLPYPMSFQRPPNPAAMHRVKQAYDKDYETMGIKFDQPEKWQRHSRALRYQHLKDMMADNRQGLKELPFDETVQTPPSTARLQGELIEKKLDMRCGNDVNAMDKVKDAEGVPEWLPDEEGPPVRRMWRRRQSIVLREEYEKFAKLLDVGF